ELDAIGAMLGESSCRVLTLTGPGGVGKSHLAYEAAKELARLFVDGSCLVPLNPVQSPAFIPLAIASALAFQLSGRRDPTEQLAGFLRGKQLLLVLDDFDRLLDGAPIVTELLARTSGLKLLITSRQRLDLRYEHVMPVRGLPVPPHDTGDDVVEYDAVRLFLEHANRMNATVAAAVTDVASVVRICRFLEGLPLGIEMAAGWARVLTCAEILAEIERDAGILTTSARDVPAHHRSMTAVLSQSWRRLSDRERSVVGRLSVFGHGFRREAAEYIGADLHLLAGLMDRSLISRDTTDRYHLHELLRQFVGSQLSLDGEALRQARQVHADYFARYVSERRGRLHQRGAEAVFDEMEEELANMRIGLDWALTHLELDALEGFLSALHAFLHGRGWLAVDGQTLDQAIQVLRAASGGGTGAVDAVRRLLGVALVLQADTNQALGKFGVARDRYEEAMGLLREHGTPRDLAMALLGLGGNAGREGHYEDAAALLEEALRHATACGDHLLLAQCCDAMGSIEMYRGGYANAQTWHARSLSILGEAGDRRTVAMALNNLGNASYCLGEMAPAREHYQAALAVNREIGSRRGIRTALGNLGNVAFSLDDFTTARQCYRESLEVAREMGDEHGTAHALYQMGTLEGVTGNHGEAKRLNRESLEIHEKTGERRGKGLALVALARACQALGEREQAIASVDAAVALFRELGERWSLCTALEEAGDAHRANGAAHSAIEAYGEGLRIAVEINARALIVGFAGRFAPIMQHLGAHEHAALLHAFILASGDAKSKARREAADAMEELEKELGAAALDAVTARARSLTTESLMPVIEAALAGLAPRLHPRDP
ncbi:MAG: tetratricopeptide repeat protein, partial [Candidatus Eisenbacteria bacterium]|nr:tetratricopeptide repeat protein [Candidatus Eisenbacteria bacterium]